VYRLQIPNGDKIPKAEKLEAEKHNTVNSGILAFAVP
jgi:hypothetical protein